MKYLNAKKWFKFGIPVSIWSTLGLLLPYLDRYYIRKFYDAETLGIYSSISELTLRAFSFIFPLILSVHPRIINLWNDNQKTKAINILDKIIKLIFFSLCILLIVLFFFKDTFFIVYKIALPMIKEDSIVVIVPLIMNGALWQLSFLTHKMIELDEKTYFMTFYIMIAIIINLIGNNIFLPKYGIIATAYTSFLSAGSYCLLTFYLF